MWRERAFLFVWRRISYNFFPMAPPARYRLRSIAAVKRFPDALAERLRRWRSNVLSGITASRTPYMVTLALIVGVAAGLSAYVFHTLISFFSKLTVADISELDFFGSTHDALRVLFPAIGALGAGLLMATVAKEYRHQGVPEVIHALLRRGGRMRLRATLVKSWAAVFTIGSGGSAGPEGPIAEIGGASGSFLGRFLPVSPPIMRMLVAGGAAGGIAASFHAPVGGVFFALEVLLAEFTPQAFSIVVLSSITATVVSRAFLGGEVYFSAPAFVLGSTWELALFALLGVLAGFVSKAYVRFLDGVEGQFKAFNRGPIWLKPALGGLIVGGMALLTPQILGTGHGVIERALWGDLPLNLMVALLLAKTLATSVTIGSGGVGGVFLPGFYVGAMLGGAFGLIVHNVFAGLGLTLVASPGAFALVGMAALLAGSTRAPITSVIIIFEIVNDYQVILPVMIATVLSTMIARAIESSTIYTRQLSLRGLKEPEHQSVRALQSTTVAEVMTRKVFTISPALPLDRLARLVETRGHSGFPVVDEKRKLVGLVTFDELRDALGVEDLPHSAVVTGDVMRTPAPMVYPDQTIGEAVGLFSQLSVDRLPVVSRTNRDELMGIITQADVLSIYRKLLV